MSIKSRTTFHGVGQGLFYSTELKINDNSFNFVYDCGSNSKRKFLQLRIDEYYNSLENKNELNLLIISHFDSDHVNGLEMLLSKFKEVEYVVLPYIHPYIRLIYAIKNKNQFAFYYNFLSDPVKYLKEKGVKNIIFIVGNENKNEVNENEDTGNFNKENIENGFYLNLKELKDFNIQKIFDDKLFDDKYSKNELKSWKKEDNVLFKISDKKVFLYYNNHKYPIWEFLFFNYKVNFNDLKKFINCVNNIIKNKNIKEVIKNAIFRKQIRECYKLLSKKELKTINNTSLIMYHSPLKSLRFLNFCSCEVCKLRYFRKCYICCEKLFSPAGQFLIGDIDLNYNWKSIVKFFNLVKDNISIVSIPHHGARRNWNSNILNFLSNGKLWVASAGLGNRYGHPNVNIFLDILSRSKKPLLCNEFNQIEIIQREL